MKKLAIFLLASFTAAGSFAAGSKKDFAGSGQEEEDLFQSACQLYQQTAHEKSATIQAFNRFLKAFSDSPRAADAQFMIGESNMEDALTVLKAEAASKKQSADRLLVPKNVSAVNSLTKAREAFAEVVSRYRKKQPGIGSSAQYRLGETAYNAKDWGSAIEEWRKVEKDFNKTYIVPEAWMGIIFANLALEQFSQAEANVFLLGEIYPNYLKVPEVLYAQGIISLHKGDYSGAERALKLVHTPEALFYLGKTYLLSKRPFLAAATFEQITREFHD